MFLPGGGIPRGTVLTGGRGDPLTRGWAAVEGARRNSPEEVGEMPRIPVQPVGYRDAK